MRPAPSATFEFPAQRAPRLMAGGLSVLAVGGVAFWGARQGGLSDASGWIAAALGLAVVSIVALWRSAGSKMSLRWDGSGWYFAQAGAEDTLGDLAVLMDLGPWLLLRFTSAETKRSRWLSVNRAAVAPRWHTLRCAVYSPRPAAAASDASPDEAAL